MDIGQTLATAASALLGAWAGSAIALARFKRERMFDRRLLWYEEMYGALKQSRDEAWLAIQQVRASTDNPSDGDSERADYDRWLATWGTSLERIGTSLDKAAFYAPSRTLRALKSLESALNRFTVAAHSRGIGQDPVGWRTRLLAEFVAEVDAAMKVVAAEVREELGLGKVPRD